MTLNSTSDARGAAGLAFLAEAGWSGADLSMLGQDASSRRYFRVTGKDGARAMLMDAPPGETAICPPEATSEERDALGWNALTRLAASRVDAFVLIAQYLRAGGFRAPEVFAHDATGGFALIEDFGEGLEFARLIESGDADEVALYEAAAETLGRLHGMPAPTVIASGNERWPILEFDAVALKVSADLYADWFPRHSGGDALGGNVRARWEGVRDGLISRALAFPREFTLRDYHAENLLWLDGDVGLLDFQDAVMGWDAWDMSLLIQDARRDVSDAAAEAATRRYLEVTGKARADFEERLAVIGGLNAMRICGIFVRLMQRDGKPRYGDFLPRQKQMLARNLAHPSMKEAADFVRDVTPSVFEDGGVA